jgi:hypothetical protein
MSQQGGQAGRLKPTLRAARSDIRLPAGGELAIYAPAATANRTRCADSCMVVSALGVPATHRLTTMPLTGGGLAADAPIPGPCLQAMSASVRLRRVPARGAMQ